MNFGHANQELIFLSTVSILSKRLRWQDTLHHVAACRAFSFLKRDHTNGSLCSVKVQFDLLDITYDEMVLGTCSISLMQRLLLMFLMQPAASTQLIRVSLGGTPPTLLVGSAEHGFTINGLSDSNVLLQWIFLCSLPYYVQDILPPVTSWIWKTLTGWIRLCLISCIASLLICDIACWWQRVPCQQSDKNQQSC